MLNLKKKVDKAENTATEVVCRWAGAVIKNANQVFGQKQ